MSEYRLGERVVFTHHLHRRFKAKPSRKVWEAEGWPGQPESEEREGVVIGERTLANGVLDGGYGGLYDYEPVEFRATKHFKAYLISFDLRRKPVLALPEHVRRKIELLLEKPCESVEEHPPHKWPGKHWCHGVGFWA